jgi:hypothetical protein
MAQPLSHASIRQYVSDLHQQMIRSTRLMSKPDQTGDSKSFEQQVNLEVMLSRQSGRSR